MQVEAFLIADSAADYQGKLCVLGAFDYIAAPSVPVKYPHSSVALRLRFDQVEQGEHKVKIVLITEDGKTLVQMEGAANVQFPPQLESVGINLILNMNGLEFPSYGTYQLDLAVDGQLRGRLPLRVLNPQALRKAA
jgi:hypothetical protein